MTDVFVSYKAEDKKRVKPLVEALEAEGYSVWWDEQIGGGAVWRQAIETELNAAKSVIVAWSKKSVGPDGTFVQDEATRAQHRHVYIPVTIDKVHLPLGFGETQALPLSGWRGDRSDPRFQAILSAVQRLAGNSTASAAPYKTAGHGGIDRRTAMVGGGIAAAAIAGVGGWTLLRSTSAGAESNSIAVLPFANLSGDPSQAYFSDGIAEELRSALGRLAGLKVVGRTSSEAVREDDAETAADKLGVANILTGSVRQSPSTIRVGAQLVDGTSGLELWSQNYDREPGDAIKIQTDIAENVADALSLTLGAAGHQAITVGGTKNPEAQRLIFKAIETSRDGGPASLRTAIALADTAIGLDPDYADAYARKGLYLSWFGSSFAKDSQELAKFRRDATQNATVALKLAPDLATGHRALADIQRVQLEVAPSIVEYRRSIELAPGDGDTLADFSILLAAMGAKTEPLNLVERSITLDPLNPNTYLSRMIILLSSRRLDEALAYGQQIEREKPRMFIWPEIVSYILILKNRIDDARLYVEKAHVNSYNRIVNEVAILARTGKGAQAGPKLDRMRSLYGDAASFQFAQCYAQLGDKDRAFAALDRALEIRDSGLLRTKTDPFLDPLRGDPRFATVLRRLNFPSL